MVPPIHWRTTSKKLICNLSNGTKSVICVAANDIFNHIGQVAKWGFSTRELTHYDLRQYWLYTSTNIKFIPTIYKEISSLGPNTGTTQVCSIGNTGAALGLTYMGSHVRILEGLQYNMILLTNVAPKCTQIAKIKFSHWEIFNFLLENRFENIEAHLAKSLSGICPIQ